MVLVGFGLPIIGYLAMVVFLPTAMLSFVSARRNTTITRVRLFMVLLLGMKQSDLTGRFTRLRRRCEVRISEAPKTQPYFP